MSIQCAVVGASGFTGLELLKMLVEHPVLEIAYVANSEGGTTTNALHPSLTKILEMDVERANPIEIAKKCTIAFLALPHKSSMQFAKELLKLGVKVVDLSADYRLDLETYETHYCKHEDKENLGGAIYGLPEYYRDSIKESRIIANPGCYPTAALLALLPFVEYIDATSPIFIDAKSGVSGAGKKCTETTQFVAINENTHAYAPITHRHAPEIIEKVEKIHGVKLPINFIPHLLPVTRGMLVSVFAKLKEDINPIEILKERYRDELFVRIMDRTVDIKSSSGTNFCDIFALKNGNALFVSSSIDNLLRGSSSQALVNANIMLNLPEDCGIPKIAYVP